MVIIASEVTNGDILLYETSSPVMEPSAMPKRTEMAIPRINPPTLVNSQLVSDILNIMLPTAATEPTDKSMPPVKITNSIPILTRNKGTFCLNKLETFWAVKKASDNKLDNMINAASMKKNIIFDYKIFGIKLFGRSSSVVDLVILNFYMFIVHFRIPPLTALSGFVPSVPLWKAPP